MHHFPSLENGLLYNDSGKTCNIKHWFTVQYVIFASQTSPCLLQSNVYFRNLMSKYAYQIITVNQSDTEGIGAMI